MLKVMDEAVEGMILTSNQATTQLCINWFMANKKELDELNNN